jgi:hypothetical protein
MRKTKRNWKLLPLARAIGVLSAVGVVTTLVTFAAIQSTGNALTGNTIETATASLKISKDGSTFSDTIPGFDFAGVMPGGVAVPAGDGYLVELKNTGDTTLKLRLTVPTPPTVTGITDLSKVNVLITPFTSGGGTYATQSIALSALIAGQASLNNATAAAKGSPVLLHLQVSMAADAIDGAGGSISNLDLTFSGTP